MHAVRLTGQQAQFSVSSLANRTKRCETRYSHRQAAACPDCGKHERGELEAGDGHEGEEICAEVEELVDDVGDEPERAGGRCGDALRRRFGE